MRFIKRILSVAFACLFVFAASSCKDKKSPSEPEGTYTDVYILAGQSNAVGYTLISGCEEEYKTGFKNVKIFQDGEQKQHNPTKINAWFSVKTGLGQTPNKSGIELGLAKTLSPVYADAECRIIRYGWGGKTLYNDFTPPSIIKENDSETRGQHYRNAVETVKNGLSSMEKEGLTPRIRAILWMQGEHDATQKQFAEAYESNLQALIGALRAEFGDVYFLIGQIAANSPNNSRYAPTVIAAQNAVSEQMENVFVIDTADLPLDIQKDAWHWQLPEMLELGNRFGEFIKQVIL
ncbi:MAG: hypothetical protein IJY62_00195 [Clostridia bacterium]|nr:hypothetical protein [Clostridia bacterium]